MERDNIINLGSKRLERVNDQKRRGIEITPGGDFLYPEDRVEITEAEAIVIAHSIIEKYPDEEALVQDFAMHENGNLQTLDDFLSIPITDRGEILYKTQRSFISQQEEAAASETKDLVAILQMHRKQPKHFYRTRLLAVAKELVKRFPENI